MAKLDRTFPTNNCDLCTLSPHLSETGRSLHIELHGHDRTVRPGRRGRQLQCDPGDPTPVYRLAEVHRLRRMLSIYFPEFVRFTPGLDHRAPTCMRYPQATPYAFSIDRDACSNMDELVQACPVGAILPQDTAREQKIEVGSVILSPGAEVFNPQGLETYGYGVHPNVVTSLEYERILSASGPTLGELLTTV